MLTRETLEKIRKGEITSRRQLYAKTGRSRKLKRWLDEHDILMPVRWDKERVKTCLRDKYETLADVPRANQCGYDLVTAAQRLFGSWNEAIYQTFGVWNQRRYSHLSDEDLLDIVRNTVKKHQRIPNRHEFDGTNYPYFETYFERFGVTRWSEVLVKAGISSLKVFGKHGWGKIYQYQGRSYLSHAEFLIGRYLTDHRIEFDKEVPYGGGSGHLFDFYLPSFDTYIEYYGIETADYLQRIEEKRSLYAGRRVIEIFKHDNTLGKLSSEVQRLQSSVAA